MIYRKGELYGTCRRTETKTAALEKVAVDKGLDAIVVVGNCAVGPESYGSFRYFADHRSYYYLHSPVVRPGKKITICVGSILHKDGILLKGFEDTRFGADVLPGVLKVLAEQPVKRIGVSFEMRPVRWENGILEQCPGAEPVDVDEDITALRRIHSPYEVECFRKSAKITDADYAAICRAAVPGAKESEIVAAGNYAMRKMGMEQSFMLISSGRFSVEKNTMQLLHHTSSIDNVLKAGDSVALEMTPRYNGYWTQIVRTISVGGPNPDLAEFVRVTRGIIEAGKAVMKAGLPISDMVAAMGRYATAEGCRVREPLGHICAVDLNEERVSKTNERLLTPGMCVILHPTVVSDQVPNGIFWGESCIVTETGYEKIMDSSCELCISRPVI